MLQLVKTINKTNSSIYRLVILFLFLGIFSSQKVSAACWPTSSDYCICSGTACNKTEWCVTSEYTGLGGGLWVSGVAGWVLCGGVGQVAHTYDCDTLCGGATGDDEGEPATCDCGRQQCSSASNCSCLYVGCKVDGTDDNCYVYTCGDPPPSCTRVDGYWSVWSLCLNGVQTRECIGEACGGTCPNDGFGTTRACANVRGIVWSDDDKDGVRDTNEDYAPSVRSCSSKAHPGFSLSPDPINAWECNTNNVAVFSTRTIYETGTIVSETLSGLPSGFSCDTWEFRNPTDADYKVGLGCTADNVKLTGGATNTLRWKISKKTGNVIGRVWNERDYDTPPSPDYNEYWTGAAPTACSSITSGLQVQYSGSNILNSWPCDGTGSYYLTANTVPTGIQTLTLANVPAGYTCANAFWSFANIVTGQASNGTGCTASVNIAEGLSNNYLSWWLRRDCEVNNTYNLKVNVNEVADESGDVNCPGIRDAQDGVGVLVQKSGLPTLSSAVSLGEVNFNNISTSYKNPNLTFTASGTATSGGITDVYSLACPGVLSYNPTIFDARYCEQKTVTLGILKQPKVGWVSTIDADIFAGSIDVSVPLGSGVGASGFEKVLVNSIDGVGGYIFSMADKSTSDEDLYESGLGGYAPNVGPSASADWLDRFSFDPPNHDEVTEIDSFSDISGDSGKVYKMTRSNFATEVSTNKTYSFTSGVSILYVTADSDGNVDPVTISGTIQIVGNGRFVIVSKPAIVIDKDLGTPVAAYNINQAPTIMAAIISEGTITVESQETDPGTDIPIMLTAPLVSKAGIEFKRDLGHNTNALIPAESVLRHPQYLFYLASLEKEKSQDYIYYTGLTLTTYDLDFEYIY